MKTPRNPHKKYSEDWYNFRAQHPPIIKNKPFKVPDAPIDPTQLIKTFDNEVITKDLSRTKHHEAISKMSQREEKRSYNEPSKVSLQKLAAAQGVNYSTVSGLQTKKQLNLYSEQKFIEEYAKQGIQVYSQLEDPYTDSEKDQLHENFRREPATRRSATFLAQFILGKRTHLVIDVARGFATKDREEAALKKIQEDEEVLKLVDEMATIDIKVNLFDRLNDLIVAGHNFGRAVLVIQRDSEGIPINLIPLWSLRLGKVYVNALTHELLGVEYLDYEGEDRILKAQDIIYYTVDDYPITPNSRHFGLAPAETTMAIATANRITIEIAIAEVVKKLWAPTRIIRAPDIKNQATLDKFAATLLPGKDTVTNLANLTVEYIQADPKLMELIQSLEEREKFIFRAWTVPLIIGFQEDQPMATAQASLHQWTVSVLQDKRTDLANVIEDQWYKPMLQSLIEKRVAKKSEDNMQPQAPEPVETPETVPQESTLPQENPLMPEPVAPMTQSVSVLDGPIDLNNLPFKTKMTFENIIFDTFLEKAAAVLGFLEAGALSKEIALEVAGIGEEYIARMRQLWQEQEEAKLLKQQQGVDVPTATMPDPGDTTGTPQPTEGEPTSKPGVPSFPINKGASASQDVMDAIDNFNKRIQDLHKDRKNKKK